MDGISTSRRGAFSPVIAAIIISAVVLSVGGAVWAFSQGAMTITAEDYAEAVINMTDTICERFIIEHVCYESEYLYVWVFNYGDVDIEVKVQVGDEIYSDDFIEVPSGEMVPIDPIDLIQNPTQGEELNIKAFSRRGNNAYYRYLVP